ncbi:MULTISPECIES: hypothetical protein [Streptomyces]|uniref:hypothetical protein n=1 Tax=Streptomyces TaxID=1883 RepID=UPI003666BF04
MQEAVVEYGGEVVECCGEHRSREADIRVFRPPRLLGQSAAKPIVRASEVSPGPSWK